MNGWITGDMSADKAISEYEEQIETVRQYKNHAKGACTDQQPLSMSPSPISTTSSYAPTEIIEAHVTDTQQDALAEV